MGTIRDNISKNIAYYRRKSGMTQKELAERVGVKHNSVSTWESGGNAPDVELIFKLSDVFGVSVAEIYGQDIPNSAPISLAARTLMENYDTLDPHGQRMVDVVLDEELSRVNQEAAARAAAEAKAAKLTALPESDLEDDEDPEIIQMRLFDVRAAAGLGNYVGEYPSYEIVDVELGDVPRGADFLVAIGGDSMEPKYNDGDIVFVRESVELNSGEIGIFVLDGDACCKKLVKEPRRALLRSLNSEYEDIDLSKYDYCRTVGKVVGVYQQGK